MTDEKKRIDDDAVSTVTSLFSAASSNIESVGPSISEVGSNRSSARNSRRRRKKLEKLMKNKEQNGEDDAVSGISTAYTGVSKASVAPSRSTISTPATSAITMTTTTSMLSTTTRSTDTASVATSSATTSLSFLSRISKSTASSRGKSKRDRLKKRHRQHKREADALEASKQDDGYEPIVKVRKPRKHVNFGHAASFRGNPENQILDDNPYHRKYYRHFVEPKLKANRILQKKQRGKIVIFKDTVYPIMNMFLNFHCVSSDRKKYGQFFKKLAKELNEIDMDNVDPGSSEVDPSFFSSSLYAHVVFPDKVQQRMAIWIRDVASPVDRALLKESISNFLAYYKSTRGQTQYESDYRLNPLHKKDLTLRKSMNDLCINRLNEQHPNELFKKAKEDAERAKKRPKVQLGQLGYRTNYQESFPYKKKDVDPRGFIDVLHQKKPFGTYGFNSSGVRSQMKDDYKPKIHLHEKNPPLNYSYQTASIACRLHPRGEKYAYHQRDVSDEMQGVFHKDNVNVIDKKVHDQAKTSYNAFFITELDEDAIVNDPSASKNSMLKQTMFRTSTPFEKDYDFGKFETANREHFPKREYQPWLNPRTHHMNQTQQS
mmetsp:Transcript_7053/g.10375  ORF Transcript_7053/g.10375 Transcript_7053/m.10375 type:complete len:601 (+) Transcript_7053:120-1922(+)|eukprot:CAMPEP_0117419754 /NCGR_PEP_ID=MMETSP0758-20121206/1243_1 /TAXON_ID=63605 /ORGANISM="Percolomonas cosmopolitus, Strain AE-1 (ATCC 50343)" /LENGTH=600 /DNA_ID=CAMNT_0005200989 /DNA_START=48 /DNA_END=1850 /DNA_ORIENTATION=+